MNSPRTRRPVAGARWSPADPTNTLDVMATLLVQHRETLLAPAAKARVDSTIVGADAGTLQTDPNAYALTQVWSSARPRRAPTLFPNSVSERFKAWSLLRGAYACVQRSTLLQVSLAARRNLDTART